MVLRAVTEIESSTSARVEKQTGVTEELLSKGAPFALLKSSAMSIANDLSEQVHQDIDRPLEQLVGSLYPRNDREASRIIQTTGVIEARLLSQELFERVREAATEIVRNQRIFVAVAQAVTEKSLYNSGAALAFREGVLFGKQATTSIVPRLLCTAENTVKQHGEGGDASMVLESSAEGQENEIVLTSFDGVTQLDAKLANNDIRAQKTWLELLKRNPGVLLSFKSITKSILELNKEFLNQAQGTFQQELHGTMSLVKIKEKEDGRRIVDIGVVGDAKASVVWIDSKDNLHVVTVVHPINEDIDKNTVALSHARARTGDPYIAELEKQYMANTYMDKYNSGPGSVSIIGAENLSADNIAVAKVTIPADAKFFKVMTYSDGIDLYAKSLEIPSWLCAILFEEGAKVDDRQKTNRLVVGPENSSNSNFFGKTPFGIAIVHAFYALTHPDAYPFSAQQRSKWDDATSAIYGDDSRILFEYLVKLYNENKTKVSVRSVKKEEERLVNWYLECCARSGEPIEVARRPPKRKRH